MRPARLELHPAQVPQSALGTFSEFASRVAVSPIRMSDRPDALGFLHRIRTNSL